MVETENQDVDPPRRMGSQKTLAMWKRLTRAILLMLATARSQMAVDYLTKRGEEQKDPPSSSTAAFPRAKKGKEEPINQGLGKPFRRFKAQNKFAKEPEGCNHRPDALRCRANSKATWWTCLDCGSRWQRPQEDPKKTPSTTFVVNEQADKIKNARGQEFPRYLPAPRGRLHQGYRQVEFDATGKPITLTQPHQQVGEPTASKATPGQAINTDDETVDVAMQEVKAEE